MKNLKRIACLVLALALVCTLGISAMAASEDPYSVTKADMRAETFPDVTDANNEEAIYALASLGVLVGYPDGTFKPGQVITRAEFAKIVYLYCGIKASDLSYWESLKSQFKDVYEGYWAEGYINFCSDRGYFKGYPDGTYKPENKITMQEAATVLLRILGYTDALKGTWPNNYNRKAVDIGLTDYISFIGGGNATREIVAQMAYNILDCYKVQYVGTTAANTGYLGNATAAILGRLLTDFKDAATLAGQGAVFDSLIVRRILSLIDMYYIDDEGFAHLYGRTNEGDYVYFDLLLDAFKAVKMNVRFADFDFDFYTEKEEIGEDMIESFGWHVENVKDGQLALDFYSNPSDYSVPASVGLASRYYLVGGDLTDFGDTKGRIIISSKGEAIFAVTDGRTTLRYYDYQNEKVVTIPYAKAVTEDYYDHYVNAPFRIFKSAAVDRLGYVTFNYAISNPDTPTALTDTETLKKDDLLAQRLYYNMTTGKFISYTELERGDVLYNAGRVDNPLPYTSPKIDLILVYKPVKGVLNAVAYQFGTDPGYVKIEGTNYTYDKPGTTKALISKDGGVSYEFMTYNNAATLMTTTEILYVPAYNNVQLAELLASTAPAFTNPYGVVTGYEYGQTWLPNIFGQYINTRTYAGVKLLAPNGETVTYEFTKPFVDAPAGGQLGDLVTLIVNADGKAVSVESPASFVKSTTSADFVDFNPIWELDGTITVNGNRIRITKPGLGGSDDIYTLADDAVIYMLTTGPSGFASAKVVTAADFLKTASYNFQQCNIFKSTPDNNTIKVLYVVEAQPNTIYTGIVKFAGEVGQQYIVELTDGRTFELLNRNELPDPPLPDDGAWWPDGLPVSSFISFRLTADNKIYEIRLLMWQYAPGKTMTWDPNIAATFPGYVMETGTFDYIYTHSVVTTIGGKTLYLNFDGDTDKTVYFDFTTADMKGKPCTMANIYSVADVPPTTNVTYIYDPVTQTILYCFITDFTLPPPGSPD